MTKHGDYKNLTALYFGAPVYEKVDLVIYRPERKLELFFNTQSYILDMDYLSISIYPDLCTSFLALGSRCFNADWMDMQSILVAEQNRRQNSESKLLPKDGIALQYETKDGKHMLILLLSDVFLEMMHLNNDLNALLPEQPYSRTEL
ncbi:hypothetical protein [Anaeromassilibacillus senegalensis]|uniref:hypothetical protein n=1 Tax=Anaeromassilibacillus senegalensis TaxID=1673717 RepID=UPI0012B5CCA8|nr:hypothetical protein [Anaeromassilibacillus senegalensis]